MAPDRNKTLKTGLVFLVVGVVLVAEGGYFFLKDFATFKWSTAPGKILSAEVHKRRDPTKTNGYILPPSTTSTPSTAAVSAAPGFTPPGLTIPLHPFTEVQIRT